MGLIKKQIDYENEKKSKRDNKYNKAHEYIDFKWTKEIPNDKIDGIHGKSFTLYLFIEYLESLKTPNQMRTLNELNKKLPSWENKINYINHCINFYNDIIKYTKKVEFKKIDPD